MAGEPHTAHRATATVTRHSTDSELVTAFNVGDRRAFALIVERHRTRLLAVARKYAKDEHDAQDILQEALFKAARNLQGFRNEATLSTWLHRLVMNSGYDYLKRARRAAHLSLDDDERISPDANPLLSHDPTPNMERALMLRQGLSRLPAAQRRALLLIDVAGLTVEKAAEELGVQPGTVKSRRSRARRTLHAHLASRE